MGKNQYGANALFQRASEHAEGRGGYKKKTSRNATLPFDCCCLTFRPALMPVALFENRKASVFDLGALLPWLKESPVSPVTGNPASLSQVVRIKFHRNAESKIHCPVTFKVFNRHTHIVCIRTDDSMLSSSKSSVGVAHCYAYEAIKELCTGRLVDPISGIPFSRKDILEIQNPKEGTNGDRTGFFHYIKRQKSKLKHRSIIHSSTSDADSSKINQNVGARSSTGILVNASTAKIFKEMEKKSLISSRKPLPSSSSTSQPEDAISESGPALSNFTSGVCAAGFTSTASLPVTSNKRRPVTVMEDLEKRWRAIKADKKDGLATIETSLGTLLFQLYFSQAPIACDNFAKHCDSGYYVGTSFHRLIPGFMVQGGDPSGTGRGGVSAWHQAGGPKTFRDELYLQHDGRGVLAMANSGPDTNGSQFYITFAPTPHLDGKHTVFGKLISGLEVLDHIEKEPVNADTDRPKRPIKVLSTSVVEQPRIASDNTKDDSYPKKKPDLSACAGSTQKSVISAKELATTSSVGKLFPTSIPSTTMNTTKRKRSSQSGVGIGRKKEKKFGNFNGW